LILACLLVGLAVVASAATAQLRDLKNSLRETESRATIAELRTTARDKRDWLEGVLTEGEVIAVYSAGGLLLRPAPPAVAPAYEPPDETLAVVHARAGKLDEAWRVAETSGERVRVLLARGDVPSLQKALSEPALAGTDLSYMTRLQVFVARGSEPDADWIDDVRALLGGPSDRLGRSLLASVEVEPLDTRLQRQRLVGLLPREESVFVDQGVLYRAELAENRRVLRGWPVRNFGTGGLNVALADPYSMVLVCGNVNEARVQSESARQKPRILWMYSGAALLLIVGTLYAFVAMGRAARLTAEKSDFVANVTHELKTPLANIRMYAESLRSDRVKEEDRAEFLDTILDEGRRLESLVEGLLHASRGPRLEMMDLDPASLIREAESRWRPRFEKEGFEFFAETPDLPSVHGDREALLRAIDNLLDNARKYGRADKRVELIGSASNGHVRLMVRDHGAGIPVADRARVLQPFTRLESADRKETQGTGLGLSLVVSAMQAHGGKIELGKVTGGGTEATLVLPVGTGTENGTV
jgi:two-component system phosphate regulon sensor histidine kinase PhoR